MLKAVHLTTVHTPFDTRILYKQCSTLAHQGYETVLIASHSCEESINGVRIRPIPKVSNRFMRMTLSMWRIFKAALEEDADIYHLHDPELLLAARLLSLCGKKVVLDMHENLPKAVLTKRWIPRVIRPYVSGVCKMLERVLIGNLPVVFAEDSYAEDYKWIERSCVILNMPRIQSIPKSKQQHSVPTVGYIGGLAPDRGSLVTLEALSILQKQKETIEFECVGPASVRHAQELKEHVAQLGLQGVTFHGRMPSTEGYPLIAKCHIGLAVLKAIPNYAQSYPTKMFEYMAMGLPVIVTDVPLYRDVIETENCGLCVDAENPESIAKAISWCLSNPKQAKEMGERGRRAVMKRFSWEVESKKLLALYDEVLNEKLTDPNILCLRRCQGSTEKESIAA